MKIEDKLREEGFKVEVDPKYRRYRLWRFERWGLKIKVSYEDTAPRYRVSPTLSGIWIDGGQARRFYKNFMHFKKTGEVRL